jgi:hypothetical protein
MTASMQQKSGPAWGGLTARETRTNHSQKDKQKQNTKNKKKNTAKNKRRKEKEKINQ